MWNWLCRLSIEYRWILNDRQRKSCLEIASYCLICEISWGKRLFFETLIACRHIDHNSTKKHSLHKRRHRLSVNKLLIHINHIGACHYKSQRLWSPLREELLSVSLELIYLSPKVSRLRSLWLFGSGIGFVYISVYSAIIATSQYVNKRQRLYSSHWYKDINGCTTMLAA